MERRKIEFRITKWNIFISLFLILLNAIAPNPPFEWNLSGWFWMTLPFMYAIYIFIVAWVLAAISNLLVFYH